MGMGFESSKKRIEGKLGKIAKRVAGEKKYHDLSSGRVGVQPFSTPKWQEARKSTEDDAGESPSLIALAD